MVWWWWWQGQRGKQQWEKGVMSGSDERLLKKSSFFDIWLSLLLLNLVVHFWCWVIQRNLFALWQFFFFPFLKPKDHWSPLPEHLEQPFGGLHTLSNFLGSKFICMWRPVPHVYIQNSWNAPRMVVLAASADQGNIYVPCITCRIPPFTKFSWRMAFLFYFTKLCNVLRLNYALG